MRKIILKLPVCIFASILLLAFVGCSSAQSTQPPKVNTEFSSQAQIEYNSVSITANVSVLKENTVSIFVTAPDTLKGLTYRFTDSTLKMGYNGLDCTADEAFLPTEGFANCLYKILSSITKNEYKFEKQLGEASQFSCKTDKPEYTFTADNQSGNIIGITSANPEMTVKLVYHSD